MGKRGLIVFVLIAVIIGAVAHSFFYLASYSGGVPGFQGGILGLSVKKIDANEEVQQKQGSGFSLIAIILEWALVGSIMLFMTIRRRIKTGEETKDVELKIKEIISSENKTDIDKLYFILQQKKRLATSVVSKVFNIDKEIALKWGQTLESAGLAYVDYPRVGEPEIVLNEKSGAKNVQ